MRALPEYRGIGLRRHSLGKASAKSIFGSKTVLLLTCFLAVVLIIPQRALPQQAERKLLIGLIPEMNVFKQMERFRPFGDYLAKKTGIEVQFTVLSRYGDIIDRFTAAKMDGAFFGSFTGALAIDKLGVDPIARPVNLDKSSTYRGYIFVRKDSGIRSVRDMKGKRIAFVDRATTAGYIFPLAFLRENGVKDIKAFFSEHFFTGSHDAAIDAVLDKKADIGAAKHSIFDRMRKEDPRINQEILILAESPPVPSNGLCVRKDLDAALKKRLKDALLNLHTEPEGQAVLKQFGAVKFIEATKDDYQPVFEMLKRAGIDIKTYNYKNL
jgi:phosphonate transport system substrate-binding protein